MKVYYYIGQLARIAGVSVQTLRYYEKRGLVSPCGRNASGYRIYDEKALNRLRFVGWSKRLGFTLEEIKEILTLQGKNGSTCELVRDKAREKLRLLEDKVRNLTSLMDELQEVVSFCESQPAEMESPNIKDVEAPYPWEFKVNKNMG